MISPVTFEQESTSGLGAVAAALSTPVAAQSVPKTPVTGIEAREPAHHDQVYYKDWGQGQSVKIYPGARHGMATTHKDQVNVDLLSFIKA